MTPPSSMDHTLNYSGPSRAGGQSERLFYVAMILAMLVLVLWGFAPSFFLRGLITPQPHSFLANPPQPIRWLFLLHGTLFTIWMGLLLAQALLIGARRRQLHRMIGRKAYWLVAAMVVAGLAVGSYGALNGFHVPFDRVTFAAVPYFSVLSFALLAIMGLNERRDLQRHKRLMLLATLCLVGAGTARIPMVVAPFPGWFDPTLLLLIPLLLWDITTQRRVLPVTIWGGVFVVIADLAALPIGMTPAWHALMAPLFGSAGPAS